METTLEKVSKHIQDFENWKNRLLEKYQSCRTESEMNSLNTQIVEKKIIIEILKSIKKSLIKDYEKLE